MSKLRIYAENNSLSALSEVSNNQKISDILFSVGIRFEQWQTQNTLEPGTNQEALIQAYQTDIDRLMNEGKYKTVDVVSLAEDNPKKEEFRQMFLKEHTHSEDEVRFFVAGQGLFTLHIDQKVYQLLCTKGDLLSVPANTKHWFDMGPNPNFTAIRLFSNTEGWVANYTGSPIAENFPRLDSSLDM